MKYLLLILFFFSLSNLHSQTVKNYLLRANIGYNYKVENRLDTGAGNITLGEYNQKINDLTCSVSAGRRLKSNFYYGFGFTYNAVKDDRIYDEESINQDDSSGYGSYYVNYGNFVSSANSYSPSLYFEYYFNISDHFTFAIDLYSQYDFLIQKSTILYSTYHLAGDTIVQDYDSYTESRQQYFRLGISPTLRFNIIKNLGIELSIGSVEYHRKTKDSSYPHDFKKSDGFVIGFEPENWRLGFYIKI